MQINVAQLLKEPVGTQRNYKIDELTGEKGENRVVGEVSLIRTNRGILVEGNLTTGINGTCSRCLGKARMPVAFDFEDEFYPVINKANADDSISCENNVLTIDNDNILDLNELIRQYIITATPTKLLCKPECPGICPVCGHELAKGNCGHVIQPRDSRWEKLVELEKENKV
jgi:uncharacterized protein